MTMLEQNLDPPNNAKGKNVFVHDIYIYSIYVERIFIYELIVGPGARCWTVVVWCCPSRGHFKDTRSDIVQCGVARLLCMWFVAEISPTPSELLLISTLPRTLLLTERDREYFYFHYYCGAPTIQCYQRRSNRVWYVSCCILMIYSVWFGRAWALRSQYLRSTAPSNPPPCPT